MQQSYWWHSTRASVNIIAGTGSQTLVTLSSIATSLGTTVQDIKLRLSAFDNYDLKFPLRWFVVESTEVTPLPNLWRLVNYS